MKISKYFKNKSLQGIMWAALASTSWAVSGTVLQFASQNESLPSGWFLSARTGITGVFLLALAFILYRGKIFHVFASWKSTFWIVSYGAIGLALNLYSFYLCIQAGNAASATILQYLSPLFILLGSFLFQHKMPKIVDIVVFFLALLGILMTITGGNLMQLAISPDSLWWGIVSGLTAACYVVLPRPLAQDPENSPITVLGWGTFIAAIIFNIHQPVWVNVPNITAGGALSVASSVILGTIIPFLLILHATNLTSSEDISLVDAIQPVMTVVFTMIMTAFGVFTTTFNWVEILGIVVVVLAIYLLQADRKKNPTTL